MSNFSAESTYAVLQCDYEWKPSYYTVTSLPIVWEVRIASSLRSRTGGEDPFLVGEVQDFVVNLSNKVRAPLVLICFFSVSLSSPQKSFWKIKKTRKNPPFSLVLGILNFMLKHYEHLIFLQLNFYHLNSCFYVWVPGNSEFPTCVKMWQSQVIENIKSRQRNFDLQYFMYC